MLNRFWHNNIFLRVVVLAALLFFVVDGMAWAHSELVSAEPAAGETLTQSPQEFQLMFNEPLHADSVIVLRDAALREISTTSAVSGEKLTAMLYDELKNGVYTVEYHVLSSDSHTVTGSYQFGVNVESRIQIPPGLAVGIGIVVSVLGRMSYRRWQTRDTESSSS